MLEYLAIGIAAFFLFLLIGRALVWWYFGIGRAIRALEAIERMQAYQLNQAGIPGKAIAQLRGRGQKTA